MSTWTGRHTVEAANRLWAGSQSNGNPPWNDSAFTPADAYSIDSKMDDGMPGTGFIVGYSPNTCSTTNDTDTGKYSLTNSNYICGLIIALNR